MNKLIIFAADNPYLLTALVLMLLGVITFELRLRARAVYQVSSAEAVRMINQGATVVDLRDPARFAAGHIVNAVNIPSAELATGQEGKIKKKKGVVVVCDNGNASLESARKLRAAGFDGAFSLGGGLDGWLRDNQPLVSPQVSG